MNDIIAGSPAPTKTTARDELLSALLEHDASGWIPEIHLDDCEDDACQGCDPQYLAEKAGAEVAAEWNAQHPIGTPVTAYPGVRGENGLTTKTRSRAWVLGHGKPVVAVEGYGGGISLTHIDVIADGGESRG